MVGLSLGEKHFIQGGIAQDLRSDGRKRLTYRPIYVETGVIPQANGSARVRLGATDVIASVKAELGKPHPLQPDKGKVAIYVDCSPTAAPIFEAALSNTGIPRVNVAAGASGDEEPEVDVSDEEFLQFDTSGVPVIITLTKVGRHYIVDATTEEESQMSSAVSISVNRQGHICGLTKRGGAGVDPSIILDMISVAKHGSKKTLFGSLGCMKLMSLNINADMAIDNMRNGDYLFEYGVSECVYEYAMIYASRESREKCVIEGFEIPSKTRILVNAWALGRDPEHWMNSDCFWPERFLSSSIDFKGTNFEFIPFGAGRRICPGISFGLANVELALAQLLYHFDWELPDGIKPAELDMTETFGVTCKIRNDLYLLATPFVPFLNKEH
ncbi:hypothetical protein FEM48_Zijuj04G0136700 [Ziziphus jujuba var. spinosa]|uniref:Uncharacterized protein n=1 Tax=Ziziphus jujuba var. spinosa TaxID=714518 RepID=A0A978VK74_ZIZJJ|nr:hypothetical protein FEM48_Zijuj04G0136700 [Ziziphus jujuba var. spinosa]